MVEALKITNPVITNNIVTLTTAAIGTNGSGTLSIQIDSLELNTAANMFLVNNQTNIVQMSMKGLSGTPVAGATGRAAVDSALADVGG